MSQRIRLEHNRLPYPFGGNPPVEVQDFSITLTGLSMDELGAYGQVENHANIGYTITPDNGTHTVKWSEFVDASLVAEFGTGAAPTDFSVRDGLTVTLHVTDRGITESLTFAVRRAPGNFPIIPLLEFEADTGIVTHQFDSATGIGLSWNYALIAPPDGVTLNESTRTLSIDTDLLDPQLYQYSLAATDQYGRVIINDQFFNINPIPIPIAVVQNDEIFWTINVAITSYDIKQLFVLNGNTGTYVVTGLPTGLSRSGDNIVGTPTVASSGDITVTFTDSLAREVVAKLTYQVAAAPNIFSNFVWDEPTGNLLFDATQTGTYDWFFGANTGTFSLVAGANSPTINLSAYSGQTAVFRITKDGQELYVDANLTVPVLTDIVLSNSSGTKTGTTTANGSVTSDTGAGVLYAGVWPAAQSPNAAAIKAGTGAVYHTSDATPTAGANSFSATGLTPNTGYRWNFYQENGGDVSNTVRTTDFTTDPLPSLVEPVILDCVITGVSSGNVASFSAGYPAHNAGDGLIVYTFHDDRVELLQGVTITPLEGDTMFSELGMVGLELNNNTNQAIAVQSCVASATRVAASSGLVCTLQNGTDAPWAVAVVRVQAGTFRTATPRMQKLAKTFENATPTTQKTAALEDVQEKGLIISAFNIAFTPPTITLPGGYSTIDGPDDYGATVAWLIKRDASASANEDIAQQTVTSSTNGLWVGVTGVIMPNGS